MPRYRSSVRSLTSKLHRATSDDVEHKRLTINCFGSVVQGPGLWMLNDVSCPEVEELMDAFKTMTTVVKFANLSLESGNVNAAEQHYIEALVLFKKLQNSRGVS